MQSKWFIVLPPDGAARQAGLETIAAFESLLGKDRCASFDCSTYLSALSNLLKTADDNMIVDLLNQSMLVQCLAFGATHLLVLALAPVTLFALSVLKKQHIHTAHWFYEDFRRATYWKDVLAGYNSFFAIQKGPIADECLRRNVGFAYLPTAVGKAHVGANVPPCAERTVDVAFIGIPSLYRIEILEYLAQNGISLVVAGSGWTDYHGPLSASLVATNWVNETQAQAILHSARIGINLSLSSPDTDPANAHVSPRVFDVLAAGCALVAEDVPLAKDALQRLHVSFFSGKKNAELEIKNVLKRIDAEQPFCDANAAAVAREHTYLNRVREIVVQCE
jgi:hypothetical protein